MTKKCTLLQIISHRNIHSYFITTKYFFQVSGWIFLYFFVSPDVRISLRKKNTFKETVTFNADGTEAYSDQLTGNILHADGVIYAKNFWYKTNTDKTVMIDVPYSDEPFALLPETFYWNIETVKTKEIALRYHVYLSDSLNSSIGKEAGAYATNAYAILTYTNYLGKECQIETVSPVLAWKSAVLNYGFYLVNDAGEPVNSDGVVQRSYIVFAL